MSPSERREMIRKENTDLSLTRQCKLLKISRSSVYYTPVGFDQATIDLKHEIDGIFAKYRFFGSRQIADYLPQSGFSAGRYRVRRLMGIMGLQAIYKGPNTSKKHPEHRMYPYLLRKLPITQPNHAAQSRGPIRFGAATSPTSQSKTAFRIWWRSWIGRREKC